MDKVELDDGREEDADEEVRGIPFLIRPLPSSGLVEDGKTTDNVLRWLKTEDQATEWLSLFYGMSSKAAVM
jgi:hypothetical protein